MKQGTSRWILLASVLFTSSVLGSEASLPDLAKLAGADKVRIIGNDVAHTTGDSREIVDHGAIQALYALPASAEARWREIRGEAPLCQWRVEFERDGKMLGDYCVGSNFIEMYPRIVNLGPQQQQAAVRLLSTRSR